MPERAGVRKRPRGGASKLPISTPPTGIPGGLALRLCEWRPDRPSTVRCHQTSRRAATLRASTGEQGRHRVADLVVHAGLSTGTRTSRESSAGGLPRRRRASCDSRRAAAPCACRPPPARLPRRPNAIKQARQGALPCAARSVHGGGGGGRAAVQRPKRRAHVQRRSGRWRSRAG